MILRTYKVIYNNIKFFLSYLQIGPVAPDRDPLSTPLRELPVNKQHVLKDQLPSVFSQSNVFNKGKAELINSYYMY